MKFNFEQKPESEKNKKSKLPFVLKGIGLSALAVSGLATGKKVAEKIEKQKVEAWENGYDDACKYNIRNLENKNFAEFIKEDFVNEVALLDPENKNFSENGQLFWEKEFLNKTAYDEDGNLVVTGGDLDTFKKKEKELTDQIANAERQLSVEDKIKARKKILEILNIIEYAKHELVVHLSSEEYLLKLMGELGVSKVEAREHQKVRISNIKKITCELKNSYEIKDLYDEVQGKITAFAYYICGTNKIVIPHDIYLKNQEQRKILYEAVLHEILHESTVFEKGMSLKSLNLLEESFRDKFRESIDDKNYFSSPGEMIVRKQILDLEMDKLGIKKYGEEFTMEHYLKLLSFKNKNKLSEDAVDFIEHIKPEDFNKIMNELAKLDNKGKTKYSPSFDYKQGSELT